MNARMAFTIASVVLLPLALFAQGASTPPAASQSPAAAPMAFEVASIKPNTTGEFAWSISYPGDSFRAANVTLEALIRSAYGVREDRLGGGPDWARTARFDVEARAGQQVPREQLRLMAQRLLEERFGLALAREQREQEVYELRLTRPDGRLGPDLRRAADDCDGQASARPAPGQGPPKSSTGAMPAMWGSCASIATLATALSRPVGTNVVDRTGLSGRWDFVLAFGALVPNTSPFDAPGQQNLPTVIIAVEEQWGLKLERGGRAPVEYVVITAAHTPTEN